MITRTMRDLHAALDQDGFTTKSEEWPRIAARADPSAGPAWAELRYLANAELNRRALMHPSIPTPPQSSLEGRRAGPPSPRPAVGAGALGQQEANTPRAPIMSDDQFQQFMAQTRSTRERAEAQAEEHLRRWAIEQALKLPLEQRQPSPDGTPTEYLYTSVTLLVADATQILAFVRGGNTSAKPDDDITF